MSNYSINDQSHLETLESHLKTNLYIGGNFPNAEDANVLEQFLNAKSEPNQENHLNLWSWFSLVVLYAPQIRESWKATAKPEQTKCVKPKKEEPKKEPAKKYSLNSCGLLLFLLQHN